MSLIQSFHNVVIYIPVDIGDELNNLMKALWYFQNEVRLCSFGEIAPFLSIPSYILNNRIIPLGGGVGRRYKVNFK